MGGEKKASCRGWVFDAWLIAVTSQRSTLTTGDAGGAGPWEALKTRPAHERVTRIEVAQRGATSASMHSAVSYLALPASFTVGQPRSRRIWREEGAGGRTQSPVVLSSVQDVQDSAHKQRWKLIATHFQASKDRQRITHSFTRSLTHSLHPPHIMTADA